jgi:hypothetical protein
VNGSCRARHGYSWLAGALWTPGPADPWSALPAVSTRRIVAVAWRAAAWLDLAAVPVAAALAATRWHGGPAVVSVVVAVAVYLPLTWVLSGTTRAGSPAWQRRAGGWVLVAALAVTLVPGYRWRGRWLARPVACAGYSWQRGHQNVTRSSGSAARAAAQALRIAVPQRRHGRPGLP